MLETPFGSLAEFESGIQANFADAGWQAWYARFTPLVAGGHREIFTVIG